MDNGAAQVLSQVVPFFLISFYLIVRDIGPLGSAERKSDSIFEDYTVKIFEGDHWKQKVDIEPTDENLTSEIEDVASEIEDLDASKLDGVLNLDPVLDTITFETSELKYLFGVHTRVAHQLLQVPIDIAVTAIAGFVVISYELVTNPAGATTTLYVAGYSCTLETDTVIVVLLGLYLAIGLVLWLATRYCLRVQSPHLYKTEAEQDDVPTRLEPFRIAIGRYVDSVEESTWKASGWLRYYSNPWVSIFYNALAIFFIVITEIV